MSFLRKLGLRNWFKKTKQTAGTRTHLNKQLSIESLETRITPALSTLPGHGGGDILYITQTNNPDILNVDLTGTTLTISGNGVVGSAFGVTAKNGTYTLDFSTKTATTFAGIWVEQLLDNDILNVNGLDFGKSDTLSTDLSPFITNNNITIEFYGNEWADRNNMVDPLFGPENDTLNFSVNNSGI